MTRSSLTLLTVLMLTLAVGCARPDRKTFASSWKAAVDAQDGRLAWSLLDEASRERILAGLKRSADKAAHDEDFRELFGHVNELANTSLSHEEIAVALLKQQLASGDQIIDDGQTPSIHLEGGKWVAAVEPIGFFDPDGAPLTLSVRLPETSKKTPAPGSLKTWEIPGPGNAGGKIVDIQKAYDKIIAQIAKDFGLGGGFERSLSKLINYYLNYLSQGKAVDFKIKVDSSGGITATRISYDNFGRREEEPRQLNFGAWPAAR